MPTSAQFPMNIRDQKQRQPAGSPGRRSEITVELLRTPGGAQTLDFLGAESWELLGQKSPRKNTMPNAMPGDGAVSNALGWRLQVSSPRSWSFRKRSEHFCHLAVCRQNLPGLFARAFRWGPPERRGP